jgi:hypothetical protein
MHGGEKARLYHPWPQQLMVVNGRLHNPTVLPAGKEPPYPLDRKLQMPQSRSGSYAEEKNLTPTENWTPAVQPVARYFTNWAIPVQKV